ncbi:hypothetical protein KUTeg_024862 [Tegillarca granosa]|uniref:Mediator of RNA polymerase II transcription subunit 16 n=1 Tax=Tegillarca granosa TaxID=220873 RepID=A0ABQ9E3M7_TEGGR|nr:hypothetical protein KUTeg_024862 [Tegillarca granosa]
MKSKESASLYMKNQIVYGASDSQQMRMTHVQFLNSENSDMLLLCSGGQGYSCLEIWHLIEQHMPVNQMFQMNVSQDASFQIPKWMHKTTLTHSSFLTSIAGPKLSMSKNLAESGFMPYIAISYRDGTIKLINRHTHQTFFTATDILQSKQGQSPSKKMKTITSVSSLIQTGSGCGLIAMHDGKIFVLKVYNGRDGNVPLNILYICLLLEYCMVAGYDFWDVLMSVKQGMIETLSQRLTDNYYKQNPPMQEVTGMRILSLKMALYCISTVSHQKAVDFHARLVLQAVIGVFRSLLRPKSVSIQDKSPAEKLTLLCSKMTDGDLENMLVNLEAEEFLIDSRKKDKSSSSENALPSLQPLIQWIADFCLHLLASIPLYQSYANFPGSSLLSDPSVLNTLRELLVIIRIWGVINKNCLPVFTMAANVDCLAHLFKVMTKAWLCCKDGGNLDYDDTLLDECCVLPSKILVPSTNQSFRLDCSSYTIFTQLKEISFTEGEEPEYLYEYRKLSRNLLLSDVLMDNRQRHDIIRQVHLGSKPAENVRQCSRCGGYSLLQSLAKSPIMKAWEQRWGKSCLCGGHWKLLSSSCES